MTAFSESFSTQQLLPPWLSKGAKIWMYLIGVDRGCIQSYLDAYFNNPAPDQAPYRYEAMEGETFGILQVGLHSNFSSGHKHSQGWDTLRHKQVSWIFPVVRYRISPGNLLVERQDVWIMPFAFDDTSYIMFSSREIWGMMIDHASIYVAEDESNRLRHVDVAMEGVKKFSSRSKNHLIGCIHVAMAKEGQPDDMGSLLHKYPDMADFTGVLAASAVLEGQADTGRFTEVNTLKQFRDVFDMRFAAYRAIIASQTSHTDVKNVQFYDGSNVTIDFMWSDSTAEVLEYLFGLKKPKCTEAQIGHPTGGPDIDENGIDWRMPSVRVPVKLAVSFTSDIRYDVFKTLHTYGA